VLITITHPQIQTVIAHLDFNLKFQSILFCFFLQFNDISTKSNGSHLGWRIEGGGITHNFQSGPTKDSVAHVSYLLINDWQSNDPGSFGNISQKNSECHIAKIIYHKSF
jgi:hypothetical protein